MNTIIISVSNLFLAASLSVLFNIADQKVSLVPPSAHESISYGMINGHECVDLGLSVKWATCNVGAVSPDDLGNYYAWGETETHVDYSMADNRFRVSGDCWENFRYSKYVTPLLVPSEYLSVDSRGVVDNKIVLELSDDAANVNWGNLWRIPTVEEWQELQINCTWTWITQGETKGYKVVSRINGESIFLPAAGFPRRSDSSLRYVNVNGNYWSSTLCTTDSAWACSIIFNQSGINIRDISREFWGSVRPVCP